jgi:hypothetical protein
MDKVLAWLEGKKTTLGLIALAVYQIGANAGWWGYEQNIVIIIGVLTGASFATKVNRLAAKKK